MLPPYYNDEDVAKLLLSEIASMKFVPSKTTIPVARIFGHNATKNDFGYPYLLMETLHGTVLNHRMALSIPDSHKKKFAAQLARYVYELSTLRFSKIGCLSYSESDELEISPFQISGSWVEPLSTSLEYFYLFRKGQTREIHTEHKGEAEWEAAAWFLEKSLTSMVTEEHVYGPFPLCHLDFHYNNMLVDEDFNISAVLDWSNIQTVPMERFAVSPEFIAPPAAPQEYKQAVFDFRDIFVDALASIEKESEGSSSVCIPCN
jgi:serine/threonine protein kinase